MESPIITKSIFLLFASLSFSLWSLGINFLSGDGTGMTVEGESAKDGPAIQIIRNNAAMDFALFMLITFQVLASQADLSAFSMLRMLQVYAVQLQVGGCFGELHINPTVGLAFSEVITYGRLVDEMEMTSTILLPFMGVSVKVGPGMLSLG